MKILISLFVGFVSFCGTMELLSQIYPNMNDDALPIALAAMVAMSAIAYIMPSPDEERSGNFLFPRVMVGIQITVESNRRQVAWAIA